MRAFATNEPGDHTNLHGKHLALGVTESGLSALATFAVGVTAIRLLPAAALGAYSILLASALIGASLVTQLIFLPIQLAVLEFAREHRLGMLSQTFKMASGIPLLGILAVLVAFAAIPTSQPVPGMLALSISALPIPIVSAAQDHLRKLCYLSGRPGSALLISSIQLGVALSVLTVLIVLKASPSVIPLTALSVANAASLLGGLMLAKTDRPPVDLPPIGTLLRQTGSRLVVAEALQRGLALGALISVGWIVNLEQVGFAEAARVAAQPLNVVLVGVLSVYSPILMERGARRTRSDIRTALGRFFLLVALLTSAFILAIAIPPIRNLLAALLPSSFAVSGLVIAATLAASVAAVAGALKSVVLGESKGRNVVPVEASAGIAGLVGTLAATGLGALAIPLGGIAIGVVRAFGYGRRVTSATNSINRHEK